MGVLDSKGRLRGAGELVATRLTLPCAQRARSLPSVIVAIPVEFGQFFLNFPSELGFKLI